MGMLIEFFLKLNGENRIGNLSRAQPTDLIFFYKHLLSIWRFPCKINIYRLVAIELGDRVWFNRGTVPQGSRAIILLISCII